MKVERRLLEQIADKESIPDDIAYTYALARESREKKDWMKVNIAIMNRWNLSTLEYIKSKAWVLLNK